MNCLRLKSQFKALTKNFKSCSIVNADGSLLFSKDLNQNLLTTTRLVAFQIVKKYLQPQPGDFFVLNDPENGGFKLSKLVFIAAINPNLFFIWDENFHFINFKIPPTPLFDKGQKNEFVWKALVENHSFSKEFEDFILLQRNKISSLDHLSALVDHISIPKNQQQWLKSTQEVFNTLFNLKAQGSSECFYKLSTNQTIKLKLTIEEKQNIKMFTLDLAHTSLATDFYGASHIAESAIIKKIIDFYNLGDFFTQCILDKIKIVLPPRSIVSKPHPDGIHNLELQAICSQLCEHLLNQLNSPSRKAHAAFQYENFLNFSIRCGDLNLENSISKSSSQISCIEALVNLQKINVKTMRRTDSSNQVVFEVTSDHSMDLFIQNRHSLGNSEITFLVNNKAHSTGTHTLKKNDIINLEWSFD